MYVGVLNKFITNGIADTKKFVLVILLIKQLARCYAFRECNNYLFRIIALILLIPYSSQGGAIGAFVCLRSIEIGETLNEKNKIFTQII